MQLRRCAPQPTCLLVASQAAAVFTRVSPAEQEEENALMDEFDRITEVPGIPMAEQGRLRIAFTAQISHWTSCPSPWHGRTAG